MGKMGNQAWLLDNYNEKILLNVSVQRFWEECLQAFKIHHVTHIRNPKIRFQNTFLKNIFCQILARKLKS